MADRKALTDETPEDVATLYSWANLHGAKYRDFSASRAQTREKARQRVQEAIETERRRAREEAEALKTGDAQKAADAAIKAEAARKQEQAAKEQAQRAESQPAQPAAPQRAWQAPGPQMTPPQSVAPAYSAPPPQQPEYAYAQPQAYAPPQSQPIRKRPLNRPTPSLRRSRFIVSRWPSRRIPSRRTRWPIHRPRYSPRQRPCATNRIAGAKITICRFAIPGLRPNRGSLRLVPHG